MTLRASISFSVVHRPGGNIGDFGLVMFADARLSRSVNVSANLGYILNSNPKNAKGFDFVGSSG